MAPLVSLKSRKAQTLAKNQKNSSHDLIDQRRDTGISIGDDPKDIWNKTRKACVNAINKTFNTYKTENNHDGIKFIKSSSDLAASYEQSLYVKYRHDLNAYKSRFRKDLTALKNFKTMFTEDLLKGDLSVKEFTDIDENDLISRKQKDNNLKLLDTELKNTLGTQFPTNINEIKNQNVFVGEKWGISESAAKIDPEFDVE
jgi:hypothetical protein